MDDVPEGLLEQFLTGVADDGAVLLVDAEKAAGGVVLDDADGCVLERAAEARLPFPQRLPGPHLMGGVLDELMVRLACRRVELERGSGEPKQGAVLVEEPYSIV